LQQSSILEGQTGSGNHENGDFQGLFSIWPKIAAFRQSLAALHGTGGPAPAKGDKISDPAQSFAHLARPLLFIGGPALRGLQELDETADE
jgi:hypothetical protein